MAIRHICLLLSVGLFTLSGSCNRDDDPEEPDNTIDSTSQKRVLILNEGNFGWSNASLDVYLPDSQQLIEGVFKRDNGIPLGDVAQSMYVDQGAIYLVVNNSGTIYRLERKDGNYKVKDFRNGLPSPRFLAFSEDHIFVSDFKSGGIHLLNKSDLTKAGELKVSDWTEPILVEGEYVYFGSYHRGMLFRIPLNNLNMDLADSLRLRKGVVGLQMANAKLWALTDGGIGDVLPAIYEIDVESFTIKETFEFESEEQMPSDLQSINDTLYYLNEDLYRYVPGAAFPGVLMVPAKGRSIYGYGINRNFGGVYLTDALDFTQESMIYRYNMEFELRDSFRAGILSNGFLFVE